MRWPQGPVDILPPLLPLIAGELRLSVIKAGLTNTTFAVGRLLGSFPASTLRSHCGTRWSAASGLMGLLAGCALCRLAPGLLLLLVGRFIMGLGASAAFITKFGEVLESAPPPWRGRRTLNFEGTSILSGALGGVLAGYMTKGVGCLPAPGWPAVSTMTHVPQARESALAGTCTCVWRESYRYTSRVLPSRWRGPDSFSPWRLS